MNRIIKTGVGEKSHKDGTLLTVGETYGRRMASTFKVPHGTTQIPPCGRNDGKHGIGKGKTAAASPPLFSPISSQSRRSFRMERNGMRNLKMPSLRDLVWLVSSYTVGYAVASPTVNKVSSLRDLRFLLPLARICNPCHLFHASYRGMHPDGMQGIWRCNILLPREPFLTEWQAINLHHSIETLNS